MGPRARRNFTWTHKAFTIARYVATLVYAIACMRARHVALTATLSSCGHLPSDRLCKLRYRAIGCANLGRGGARHEAQGGSVITHRAEVTYVPYTVWRALHRGERKRTVRALRAAPAQLRHMNGRTNTSSCNCSSWSANCSTQVTVCMRARHMCALCGYPAPGATWRY